MRRTRLNEPIFVNKRRDVKEMSKVTDTKNRLKENIRNNTKRDREREGEREDSRA